MVHEPGVTADTPDDSPLSSEPLATEDVSPPAANGGDVEGDDGGQV
jgi:hypothetical protein